MAEYIDRDTLRDALCETDAITMRGLEILNQTPAADVVPVVRCRDCAHLVKDYWTTVAGKPVCIGHNGCSAWHDWAVDDLDGYCHHGERGADG